MVVMRGPASVSFHVQSLRSTSYPAKSASLASMATESCTCTYVGMRIDCRSSGQRIQPGDDERTERSAHRRPDAASSSTQTVTLRRHTRANDVLRRNRSHVVSHATATLLSRSREGRIRNHLATHARAHRARSHRKEHHVSSQRSNRELYVPLTMRWSAEATSIRSKQQVTRCSPRTTCPETDRAT